MRNPAKAPGARAWSGTPAPALPTLQQLESAASIVYAAMPQTPQYRWPLLEARCGTELWVKHENHTPVGAFKVRGGLVYFEDLRRTQPSVRGVVTATRGNHGQSVGFAASRVGLRSVIVVPHGNGAEKNAAMRALGVELIEHGHDFQAAVEAADEIASGRGWHRVPSYHPLLVRGVGTYALEFLRGAPELDVVYVPIGMGSGVCGMIAARDALGFRTEIVGVVASGAPAVAISLETGRVASHDVTTRVADGMACRTPSPEALALIAHGVARIVRVTDDEIESAIGAIFADTHNAVEGAGAAGFAALLKERDRLEGRRAGIVLSGANIDSVEFARIVGRKT